MLGFQDLLELWGYSLEFIVGGWISFNFMFPLIVVMTVYDAAVIVLWY